MGNDDDDDGLEELTTDMSILHYFSGKLFCVPVKKMLGVTPKRASSKTIRGGGDYSQLFHPTQTGLRSSCIGHLHMCRSEV